jgi:hypothetical protein
MINWIEEAERSSVMENDPEKLREKIRVRKEKISANYQANGKAYEEFAGLVKSLAERINNLPIEYRESFGKVNFRKKESKLNNSLYYVSASSRYRKRLYTGFPAFFRKTSFKHIRVAYFTISRHMGMADIELKENRLPRIRVDAGGESRRNRNIRRKDWGRKDHIFRLDINGLDEKTAMDIIEWIAFRREMETMAFFSDAAQPTS